jgi:transcriptional regulator with XRE-family HTH domain
MQTLAQRIAGRRIELKLSREDLADAAGVSVAAVQMWESGKTKDLKMANLCAIADALNVRVRWLAEGAGPKEAAASFDAYRTALARRDEAKSEDRRKGWERIAAVFAKAATVLILALPPFLASTQAEASLHNKISYEQVSVFSRLSCLITTHCMRFARWMRTIVLTRCYLSVFI